jgi:hypothetical protein
MKVAVVPMTQRLQKAWLRSTISDGDRVLYADAGSSVTAKVLQKWMARARYGVQRHRHWGPVGLLRYGQGLQ